ncbi:MAG: ADP-ribosylglycohydrolase family protein [Verrucomicrobia bacterium]|nr:ADP-ribosylglycohydrolase family protein [Verrucomicrobiota bacterium]
MNTDLPSDHQRRLGRALLSLEGLSVGDAFGECFFTDRTIVEGRIAGRHAPPAPWFYTDDTIMARSIVRVLAEQGRIEQDLLASHFAAEYSREPNRGYGSTAASTLRAISFGAPWQKMTAEVFDGAGSMGNGAAMRAAPIGAYFADDVEAVIREASLSAEITHWHPDGKAGAIAIAMAAAWVVNHAGNRKIDAKDLVSFVHENTPDGETRKGLKKALDIKLTSPTDAAAVMLGNGHKIISANTVPFCVWSAAKHLDDYEEALWATVGCFGDRDTTCAIVGSIVVLSVGQLGVPDQWQSSREPLGVEALRGA